MITDSKLYKTLLDNLHDGVYLVDKDRRITYWNKGAERITGYTAKEVIGKHCRDNLLIHIDGQGTNLCKSDCPVSETLLKGNNCEAEVYLHHKKGHRVPVLVRVSPVKDNNGNITGAIETFNDNTVRILRLQQIKELEKMAYIDALTEIPNRRYLEMNLYARYNEMKRYKSVFGILMMDIDHFKKLNDTYGHDIGDKVLKMVSRTLADNTRSFDSVGRWGGEEFVAIVVNVTMKQLRDTAERFRMLVEKSMFTSGKNIISTTISIGATMVQPADTISKLMKRADKLMYQSKASGRNFVTID